MDRLYDWVDSNPPSPGRSFSFRRATKLFLAILVCSVLGGIPYALLRFGLWSVEEAKEQRQRQEKMQRDWAELEQAAREGKTGEATRRLFGVDESRKAPTSANPMPKPALREKEPPTSWKVADLNEQMPYRWEAGPVHVLVWEVIDDGERVKERCLVVKQYDKPSDRGETCALAYLRRFPKDEKPEWKAKTLWITPDPEFKNPPAIWGWACYKALPADKDIAAFLNERGWAGEVKPWRALVGKAGQWKDYDPKLIDGGACRLAWRKVFGRDPSPDLFPELIVRTEPGKK